MCLVIAAAIGGIGVLATDLRHSRLVDGVLCSEDRGGKILPVEGGWVATTGSAHLGAIGMGALASVGLTDLEAASSALRRVAGESVGPLREQGAPEEALEQTRWLAVRSGNPPTAHAFDCDGSLTDDGGANTFMLTFPPGFEDESLRAELKTDFGRRIRPTPGAVVRAIAHAFGRAAALSPYVSDDFDLGAIATAPRGPTHIYRRINPGWTLATDSQVEKGFQRTSPTAWRRPATDFSEIVAAAQHLYARN